MEEFPMKILLATVVLATLLSSSAQAQNGVWRGGYYGAYAQAPYYRTPSTYDLYGRRAPYPYSVYDTSGRYVGSDPDPTVRSQLARDPSQGKD
jgi:opacity protein-like surface antigen